MLRAVENGLATGRPGGVARAITAVVLLAVLPARAAAAANDDRALYTPDELASIYRHSPLGPVPPAPTNGVASSSRAAALGQFLFFEPRLSANGKLSCATCHQPARAFTDGRKLAKGIAVGTRNTPTLLNAALSRWLFWDGRADSLWSQALQPLEGPRELGGDRGHIVRLVGEDPALSEAYRQVFGPLPRLAGGRAAVARSWAALAPADRAAVNRVFANIGKAIAAYERKLVGGGSPFDRYVAGLEAGDPARQTAISAPAKRGLKLFVGVANCELCHSGPAFTDGQFHNLGLPVLTAQADDPGRAAGIRAVAADPFNGTGRFSDHPEGAAGDRLAFLPPARSQLGAFKTPSLRNVALTAPYMHDGRFAALDQVLDFYARGKAASQGRLIGAREETVDLIPPLTQAQKADLVAFLKTLTGTPVPRSLAEAPARP